MVIMKRILKLTLTKAAATSGLAKSIAMSLKDEELFENEAVATEMVSYVSEIRREMRKMVASEGWTEAGEGMKMFIYSANPLQFAYELRFEKNADPVPAQVED